ncbi:hypothetical protein TIFTF001_009781 [Ficus carica]|uniref:Uncharacterized protein n=1 Tax=Ficus carica TaxID=3494 RepID=A0AA88D1L2_FICCA|nr:hypothetical protein TIFTF001_009781 [Ficus carica]
MTTWRSWSSEKVAIASYVTTESAARRSWSFGEVMISSSSRSNCSCDLITTDRMPSDKDDDKAGLATTSQSRQG